MSILASLQRISSEDARQFAYRILKLSILGLLLRPGQKLNEAELADTLQMSRTPVRDVLGRLSREQLVEQIPQRGAFVSQIDPGRAEQAAWAQARMGAAVLDMLYTGQVQGAALDALRENLARQQFCTATDDRAGAVRAAQDFFRLLYRLGRMELAWDSLQAAGADFHRLAQLVGAQEGACESALLECRSLTQALAQRDSAAANRALHHYYARICAQLPALREAQPEVFVARA